MSFKRSRPSSYGNKKEQVIVQNGIAIPSPLDKKGLPLEEQSKFLFSISSDDRNQAASGSRGADIESTDCVINLLTTLQGVYGYRVVDFTFTNRFFSVQTGLNDLLAVTWATPPVGGSDDVKAGRIILAEGYYEFSSEPSDWANPLAPALLDLNNLAIANLANYLLYWPNDVRVQLMAAANPTITSIVTNRLTDKITITWLAGTSPTLNTQLTTALSVLGLSRNATGSTWVSVGPPNIDGPTNLALSSSVLNNNQLLDPHGENDYFVVVPIWVEEGKRQTYIPFNPTFVNLNSQQSIQSIPIKIVEPESGQILKANNMEWLLNVEFYSYNSNPYH